MKDQNPQAEATPAEAPASVEPTKAAAPTGPTPDSIVVNPARESRTHAILTLESGPHIVAETKQEGDVTAVISRVLDGIEKHGVKVVRVWQHGEGKTIADAFRAVEGLTVLELN